MAQFHKVTEAFQATDKTTKEPVTDQYGNSKWMFKVENQGPEGWMSVNRKEGSTLSAGDHVYGIVDTWPEGKAKFVRQNPPEGTEYPKSEASASAPTRAKIPTASHTSQNNSGVEAKLDYIISLLENSANFQGNAATSTQAGQERAPIDDEAPVDLSDLSY